MWCFTEILHLHNRGNIAGQAFTKSRAHGVSSLPFPKVMRPSKACAPQPPGQEVKGVSGTAEPLPSLSALFTFPSPSASWVGMP